ncbi:MAG: bpX6 domain-containing protein, partial [Gammaproteobacteria bacterium]
MSELRRSRSTFTGVHLATGLLLDLGRLGEAEVRRRILAVWEEGARCYRWEARVALLWPVSRRLDARYAYGALIVETPTGLTAVPPRKGEALGRAGALCQVANAAVELCELAPEFEIDPSKWVNAGSFELANVVPWPQPSGKPVVNELESAGSLREILGDTVPEPAPAAIEFKRKLAERAASAQRNARMGTSTRPTLRSRLASWLRRGGTVSHDPRRPSTIARWFASRLARSLVGDLAGRAQARYLRRLFDMFENQNLHEALRHAIALDGAGQDWASPSFGVPRARRELTISKASGAASLLLVGGPDVHAQLRRHYQAAVKRLEQQGKIGEAVFVLVELLNEPEEGVNLLERHGRLREAAELAEGCDLAPGLIVRLWFQARDSERAMAIARRRNAFADAVLRLERMDRPEAAHLRALWADSLASAGDYGSAVQVIWPIESARRLAKDWIRRILDGGGEPAARILVQHVVLEPDALEDVLPSVQRLLGGADPQASSERAAFAGELIACASTGRALSPALRPLARLACRCAIRDIASGLTELNHRDCLHLARISGDGLLIADLPPMAAAAPAGRWPEQRLIRLPSTDTGTVAIADAVLLPGDRSLVALGEAGVRMLTRDGRTVAHLDAPAHHLVVSDAGTRAIALVRRGNVVGLARLALDQRTARHWGDLRLDAWAGDFNGSTWFAAGRDTLYAFDLHKERPEAFWRVSELGGETARIPVLRRHASRLHLIVGGDEPERWTYELPDIVLRERASIKSTDGQGTDGALFAVEYSMHDLG